jgi:hypothetical protein
MNHRLIGCKYQLSVQQLCQFKIGANKMITIISVVGANQQINKAEINLALTVSW